MTTAYGYYGWTVMQSPPEVVETSAVADEFLVTASRPPKDNAWRQWIDKMLEWWKTPSLLESDDETQVSRSLIERAIRIVSDFSKNQGTWSLPPSAIVPDGNGGLSLHFQRSKYRWSIELLQTGHIDMYQFADGILVSSDRLC